MFCFSAAPPAFNCNVNVSQMSLQTGFVIGCDYRMSVAEHKTTLKNKVPSMVEFASLEGGENYKVTGQLEGFFNHVTTISISPVI